MKKINTFSLTSVGVSKRKFEKSIKNNKLYDYVCYLAGESERKAENLKELERRCQEAYSLKMRGRLQDD